MYEDGNDLEARSNMLDAAYYAGHAFTVSYVGYVHAIAHPLGGKYNIAHGLANATLLDVVLKQYGESVYKKLYEMALYCGISSTFSELKNRIYTNWLFTQIMKPIHYIQFQFYGV